MVIYGKSGVASCRGGGRMVIEDGINGFWVGVGDKSALVRKMEEIIDPTTSERISISSRKIFKELSAEKIMLRWKDLIQ